MVQICCERQLLPGPASHEAIGLLRAKVTDGELLSKQPYGYYLAALDAALPMSGAEAAAAAASDATPTTQQE